MAWALADNDGGMGLHLTEVSRCPHCAIASPLLERLWASNDLLPRQTPGPRKFWASYCCSSCGGVVTVSSPERLGRRHPVDGMFPGAKEAHGDLPQPGRRFLQQAYETLHAPDAAALMAGSAVDSFLKAKGYADGSLYKRIDEALADNVLTKGMAEWAHAVRLGANRPRHADADNPHVSDEEAKQSVDFAEALGNFLFVLTARVERGLKAAESAKPQEQ